MAAQYTTPDTFNYIQRLTRDLTAKILEDENFNIFSLRDRLSSIDLKQIDFAKHCGTPKSLQTQNDPKTSATDEGLIGIAGIFFYDSQ